MPAHPHPSRNPSLPRRCRDAGNLRLIGLIIGLLSATPSLAAGDAAAGREVYQTRCLGCHGDASKPGTTAPGLVGVFGRKAGTGAGGTTSRAAAESNFIWDEKSLNQFLASPSDKIHGTLMPVGVAGERERADVIAYLKTLH
jgi:cytochrome c